MTAIALGSLFALPLAYLAPGGEDPVRVTALMLEGDTLPNVGTVDFFNHVQVNDRGDWSVIARMSQPPTHQAVVVNGEVLYEKGGELGGHALAGFFTHELAKDGTVVFDPAVDSAPTNYSLYYGDVPLYVEGDLASPELGLWTGATHRWFTSNRWHEKKEITSNMRFDLPGGESRSAILRVRVNDAGAIVSETVVMKEAHVLPSGFRVTGFLGHAVNGSGDALLHVSTNGPVDHSAIYLGDQLLAQLYGDAIAPGTSWDFMGYGLDLNDAGDWVFVAAEGDPGQTVRIVKNGAALISEGDVLPEVGTVFVITTGALQMDRHGDVLWRGSVAGGNAWFHGSQLLVQENTASPTGSPFDVLLGTDNSVDMSDDGRFVIFSAVLDDGTIGAFLISPAGNVTTMQECVGNAGSLAWTAGQPTGGSSLTFTLDGAASDSGAAFLHASLSPIAGWPNCGIALPGIGELLIDIAPPNPVASFQQPWSGAAVEFEIPLPAAVEAIGAHVYLQGHFFDPALAEPHRLTGGIEVVIGDGLH